MDRSCRAEARPLVAPVFYSHLVGIRARDARPLSQFAAWPRLRQPALPSANFDTAQVAYGRLHPRHFFSQTFDRREQIRLSFPEFGLLIRQSFPQLRQLSLPFALAVSADLGLSLQLLLHCCQQLVNSQGLASLLVRQPHLLLQIVQLSVEFVDAFTQTVLLVHGAQILVRQWHLWASDPSRPCA